MGTLGSSKVGLNQCAQSWGTILGDSHHCHRCCDFPNAAYFCISWLSHSINIQHLFHSTTPILLCKNAFTFFFFNDVTHTHTPLGFTLPSETGFSEGCEFLYSQTLPKMNCTTAGFQFSFTGFLLSTRAVDIRLKLSSLSDKTFNLLSWHTTSGWRHLQSCSCALDILCQQHISIRTLGL